MMYNNKPEGFGDTLANLTFVMGIDITIKKVGQLFGVDCGCKKRQEKLNEIIPYKQKETK